MTHQKYSDQDYRNREDTGDRKTDEALAEMRDQEAERIIDTLFSKYQSETKFMPVLARKMASRLVDMQG